MKNLTAFRTIHRGYFFAIALLGLFLATGAFPVWAETELKFDNAINFGDKKNQYGNTAEIGNGRLYLGGSEDTKSLVVSYLLPPTATPLSSFRWQNEAGTSTDIFNDTTFTEEGFYAAGFSTPKGKTSEGIIAKFALDPSSVAVWAVKPQVLVAGQRGVFHSILTTTEGGLPFVYATGNASTGTDNRTAILVKLDKDGKVVWSKTLTDTANRFKAGGRSLAILNGFVYVAGYSGKGEKKVAFNTIPLNPTLWKYDFSGQQIWMKTAPEQLYASTDVNLGPKVDMMIMDSHAYLAMVQTKGVAGSALIQKYNQDGQLLWSKEWAPPSSSSALVWDGAAIGIASGNSDRFYVVGIQGSTDQNPFLLEMDKQYGFILASHDYGVSNINERILDVEVSGNDIYMVGSKKSLDKSANSDLILLRYVPLPVTEVKIEIHPSGVSAPEGMMAVAIFSEKSFDAVREIKQASFTFGMSGNEPSWESCTIRDVDQDGMLDLLCYFSKQFKFQEQLLDVLSTGAAKGVLKGQKLTGERIFASASVPLPPSATPAPPPQPEPVVAEPEPTTSNPLPLISEPVIASPPSSTTTSPTVQEPVTSTTTAPLISQPTLTSSTSTTTSPPVQEPLLTSTTTAPVISQPTLTSSTSTTTSPTVQEPLLTSTTTAPLISEPTITSSTSTTTTSPTVQEPVTSATTSTAEPLISQPTTTSSTSATTSTSTTVQSGSTSSEPILLKSLLPAPTPTIQPATATLAPSTSTASPSLSKEPFISGKTSGGNMMLRSEGQGFRDARRPGRNKQAESEKSPEDASSKNNPDMANAYRDLGKQALMSGHFTEAVKHFKEALELNPESAEIHSDLGLVFMKEGNLESARDYLQKALELKPDDVTIRSNLEAVLAKLQGGAKAS